MTSVAETDDRGSTPLGPCGSYPDDGPVIKRGRGGAQPGAGRKPGRKPGSRRDRRDASERPLRYFERESWYCIVAFPGEQAEADRAIRRAGFELYAPSMWLPAMRRRRLPDGSIQPARDARIVPLFGRFMFARFSLADPEWHRIKYLDGVQQLLGSAGAPTRPAPIADAEIAQIRALPKMELNDCLYPAGAFKRLARMQDVIPDAELPFEAGELVRILSGAFADFEAVCEWSDTRRVGIRTSIFGREVKTTVARREVAAAA